MKRSGKFYRKNEQKVMRSLGLNPTPNSGSGWIVKEDGQNEDIICQLKSTDAGSIKVSLDDIQTLEYNAIVSHKIPIFAIQFLKTNEVFLLIRPEELQDVSGCIYDKSHINPYRDTYNSIDKLLDVQSDIIVNQRTLIKSSDDARYKIREELNNRYKKKGKSAK